MVTAKISTKGQLVIPQRYRDALSLQPGDKIAFELEGNKLVLQREESPRGKLVMGKHGRRVLIASPGAPAMTAEFIRSLRDEE